MKSILDQKKKSPLLKWINVVVMGMDMVDEGGGRDHGQDPVEENPSKIFGFCKFLVFLEL